MSKKLNRVFIEITTFQISKHLESYKNFSTCAVPFSRFSENLKEKQNISFLNLIVENIEIIIQCQRF